MEDTHTVEDGTQTAEINSPFVPMLMPVKKKSKLGRATSIMSPNKFTRKNSLLDQSIKLNSSSPVKKKLDSWMKHTPDPICSGCITHKKRNLDRNVLNMSSNNSRN